MPPRDADLARLGYTTAWLELGILDEATLRAQLADRARARADAAPEHYRWLTLRRYLDRLTALDDAALARLVALLAHDPDPLMHEVTLVELIRKNALSDGQLATLAADAAGDLAEAIARAQLLRALGGEPDLATLERAVATRHKVIHKALLARELPLAILEALARDGAGTAIRSRAAQLARRKGGSGAT